MMKLIFYPDADTHKSFLQRPLMDTSSLFDIVKPVINEVKMQGDDAVRKYIYQFEGILPQHLRVTSGEFEKASVEISHKLKQAIQQAAVNISAFHEKQLDKTVAVETMPGIQCWQRSIPIQKIGLYVPGGSTPLFSTLLMLAIPAKLARCSEIVVCTPANKRNEIHPALLYAASISGITKIFKIGGAQAIAAMAYGTESVPQVYKILGPGNQFVTAAKQLVQLDGIAIDMPAGPSEICIIADDAANARFIAADLLSQAEHGTDSQVLLITTCKTLIQQVQAEIRMQLEYLPRKAIAEQALLLSSIVLVNSIEEAIRLTNDYAPEHLIICCNNDEAIADRIINAGSVFLGNYSPEAVGDYASGTNHTLPTNGFAKAYSGVSVDSFMKKITYQKLTYKGLQAVSGTVITMAEAEGLQAHANAVKIRTDV